MVKLSAVKTDPDRESGGVWVDWEMGISLKIARIGNEKFDAMVRKLSEPHLRSLRQDPNDEKMEEVTRKAVAKHILVGWKNIEDDDGSPLAYSAKRSRDLLTDPALRDLYKFVLITANNAELYRREIDEESVGN